MRNLRRFSLLLLVFSLAACSVLESPEKTAEKKVLQFFDLLEKRKYREAYAMIAIYNNGEVGNHPNAETLYANAAIEYERNQKIYITKLIEEMRRTGQKVKILHVEPHERTRSIYYVHIQAIGIMERSKNIFNGTLQSTKQTDVNNYFITVREDKEKKWGLILTYVAESHKGIKHPPKGERFKNTYFP